MYKLFKKINGVKSTKEIISFECNDKIVDFCCKDNDFFYVTKNLIGKIEGLKNTLFSGNDIIQKYGDIIYSSYSNMSSIIYSDHYKGLFISENSGKNIRYIDLQSNYTSNFITNQSLLDKYFSKVSDVANSQICCNEDNIYWTAPSINRIFTNKDILLAGSGKADYSVFNDPKLCSFCSPIGITNNKNAIYVSDNGNKCIRKIDGKVNYVIGNIFNNPKKIKYNSGNIYFLDNNNIFTINSNQKNVHNVYNGKRTIISFDILGNNLYILEQHD